MADSSHQLFFFFGCHGTTIVAIVGDSEAGVKGARESRGMIVGRRNRVPQDGKEQEWKISGFGYIAPAGRLKERPDLT